LFKVTNLITDTQNSFDYEQRSSYQTKKIDLKPLSISGDGKVRKNDGGVQEVACSMQPDHTWRLTSANGDAFL